MAKSYYASVLILTSFIILNHPVPSSSTISIPDQACEAYIQHGDVNIGGLFSFHSSYDTPCDVGINYWSVYLAEMMVFAVNRVNQRHDVLPNVTMGFEIRDDCVSEDVSLWAALSLVNSPEDADYGETCTSHRNGLTNRVHGIIGTGFSFTSILVGKVGSLVQVPVISFWATSDELSDKSRFPYFFRTVPPDKFQAGAIVDLLLHFDWKYVALFFSVDSYSVHGARQLRSLAEEKGICLALYLPVELRASDQKTEDVVQKLREHPKVKVAVIFGLADVAYAILLSVQKANLDRHITWIGSDGWGDDLEGKEFGPLTNGGWFVRGQGESVPIFEEYFSHVDPNHDDISPWLAQYWQDRKMTENCTDTMDCPLPLLPFGAAVVDAVDAFAYALHAIMMNSSELTLDGNTLREQLFQVSFETADGRHFEFDSHGDTFGTFVYYNMQEHNGQYGMVDVGRWAPAIDNLSLSLDSLQFVDGTNNVPYSLCTEVCDPGYIVVPLELKCCHGCQECPLNAIVVNDSECYSCPATYWPNEDFTLCEAIIPTTLSWKDPVVIILLTLSLLGICLNLLSIIGICIHRDHVLIKASSRELSAINLTGLLIAFVTVLPLLTKPTDILCAVIEALISLCYTLTYVPTLLKVNRIFRIFQSGKKSVSRPRYVRPKAQVILALCLIAVQVSKYDT